MAVVIPETEGASNTVISTAERQLSCRIPQSYRRFVSRHDGARPNNNILAVPGDEISVRKFVPVVEAAALRDGIEGFPPHAIAIAEDDCGNYVWLEPRTGAVFFWDHEQDEHGVLIADNFDDFLALLQPFDPSSIKLGPGQVISAWIDPDFKPEFD